MESFHVKHSSASVLLRFCILSIITVVVICGHHFDSPVIISDSKQDRYSPVWIPVVQPEEVEVGASECADWDDPITCQLEELLLSYLQAIFRSAIKQFAEHGYSEEVAEKVVSRGSLYIGSPSGIHNARNDQRG